MHFNLQQIYTERITLWGNIPLWSYILFYLHKSNLLDNGSSVLYPAFNFHGNWIGMTCCNSEVRVAALQQGWDQFKNHQYSHTWEETYWDVDASLLLLLAACLWSHGVRSPLGGLGLQGIKQVSCCLVAVRSRTNEFSC